MNSPDHLEKTTDRIVEAPDSVEPLWGGYKGVKQRFDWGRTYTYYKAREGKIKSVLLHNKGSRHGRRLFYLPSIAEFIQRTMEEQDSHKAA